MKKFTGPALFGFLSFLFVTGLLMGIGVAVVNAIGWGMAAFAVGFFWIFLS